ncbi:MAG TPA: isochorismate synthase [Acidimicrobiales bacterium]|nr:isochorismate synthase [Acidimicrobiales bacterium]
MTLVARTRRLDRDVDLLAVAGADGVLFERGRAGLAGRGVAARIPWTAGDPAAAARAAADALAAIDADDQVGQPGCGPVAFGALPFVPGSPCELLVPAVVVGRADDGTRWLTTIGPADDAANADDADDPDGVVAALAGERTGPRSAIWSAPGASPQHFTVEATTAPEDWCALVERATKMLAGQPPGGLSKVVLAREILVATDRPLDRVAVLQRLRSAYPGCYLLSVDGLVGASPELLVSRSGETVRSHPLAGTAPRGGDPATDQRLAASLLASAKDRGEHQITIDMVHDTLVGWCSYLDYEAEPSILAVANVQHLATLVEGRLSRPAPSVLELVAALHPTPAVAGWPREPAVEWIVAHEGFDRGRYTGTVGWADAAGNGTWAVTVRCAEIDGTAARVIAGNGIVADSDPVAELAETQAKLQALLSAIVRP